DALGDTAVCLYEDRPKEFRGLCRTTVAGQGPSMLVRAWSISLDPKQVDAAPIALLAADLPQPSPRARGLAQETREALPFLVAEPRRMADALERWGPALLEPLAAIDLSDNGKSLRRALEVFERQGDLAMAASNQAGIAGFLLVERFGFLIAELEPEL